MRLCLSTELCLLWKMLAPGVALPPLPSPASAKPDSSVKWAEAGGSSDLVSCPRTVHRRCFARSLSALAQQPQMWGLSLLAVETQP